MPAEIKRREVWNGGLPNEGMTNYKNDKNCREEAHVHDGGRKRGKFTPVEKEKV